MFQPPEDRMMNDPKKAKADGDIEFRDQTEGEPADFPKDGVSPSRRLHPPPEEDLGGGDICSPEPSADDGAM
jgi:hypothetical protein